MFGSILLWLLVSSAPLTWGETVIDDMVIIEAETRQSRQQFGFPLTAVSADLLQLGLPLLGSLRPSLRQPCVTREGRFGSCMTMNQCYPERKLFNIQAKDTWIMGLYNMCSINSLRGKQVFGVCCTRGFPEVSPHPISNEVDVDTDEEEVVDNRKSPACKPEQTRHRCDSNVKRIVNGQQTRAHEFPFMAALLRKSGSRSIQFCGGSIIDETHILTAAHCIDRYTKYDVPNLVIYLGAHDIKQGEAGRTEVGVKRIIKHKDFDGNTLVNDIAVLTLSRPVTMNSYIAPMCLPPEVKSGKSENSYEGWRVFVCGWGALSAGGSQPSKLHKVDVTVWGNQRCSTGYGSASIATKIKDSMICAADPNKDSCSGDSGGPLFAKENGMNVQVGIVSWGIGCAQPKYPGVYTRVTKMMNWINRIRNCY